MEQRVTRVYLASLHTPTTHAADASATAPAANPRPAASPTAAAASSATAAATTGAPPPAGSSGAVGHHPLPFPPPTAFDFLTLYLQACASVM